MASPIVIGAIVSGVAALGKEVAAQIGKVKTARAQGRTAIVVAALAFGGAVVAATPKFIEAYRDYKVRRLNQ